MKSLWRRLVAFGLRLLYNELAWLYDPVSWVVSQGLWRQWHSTALAYLPPAGAVLEVGFGPGHLLAELVEMGYQPAGLELSPAMLRQAQRRLRRQGRVVPLCRGRAQHLPYAAKVFDAIVLTFPTSFVYEPAWIGQVIRVLRPGGRLIVVEEALFMRRDAAARSREWLFNITGQRGPAPDLCKLLHSAGLASWRDQVSVDGTSVRLVLAEMRTVDRLGD